MTITYFKANISDVSTLVDNRILFAFELGGEQSPEKVEALKNQMTTYFTKATADQSCISIIAKCGEAIAGIGSVHIRQMPGNFKNPSGKWGYIMNMYTVPQFRRNGICKRILNLLVEEGKKIDITAFELHATKAGEMVYLQEGFAAHIEPTLRKYIS